MKRLRSILTLPAVLIWVSEAAQACSACFGKSDSPMAKGMNAGIFVLLGVVFALWVGFGSFFVFIARRSRTGLDEAPCDAGHRP